MVHMLNSTWICHTHQHLTFTNMRTPMSGAVALYSLQHSAADIKRNIFVEAMFWVLLEAGQPNPWSKLVVLSSLKSIFFGSRNGNHCSKPFRGHRLVTRPSVTKGWPRSGFTYWFPFREPELVPIMGTKIHSNIWNQTGHRFWEPLRST